MPSYHHPHVSGQPAYRAGVAQLADLRQGRQPCGSQIVREEFCKGNEFADGDARAASRFTELRSWTCQSAVQSNAPICSLAFCSGLVAIYGRHYTTFLMARRIVLGRS